MANNFKERLSTYVNCLQKMLDAEFEYSAIQRELYKFIQFGIDDDYSVEERKGIVESLVSISNSDKVNTQQRALILANAYKLDQINGLGLDVPLEHLEEAVNKQGSIHLMDTINSLNDIERTLLRAVVESDEILTAGELSKQFKEEANVSYATFNRTLEKLEFLRLVDTKYTGKGVRGNSREIILRFSPDDIKRCNL